MNFFLPQGLPMKAEPNTPVSYTHLVSHHMNKLQKSGLTTSTLEGCKVYYKTNEEVVDEFIRRLAEKLKTKDGQ